MKIFTALATAAIAITGLSARPVQAAPAWAQITANMACYLVGEGFTPSRAGEIAGKKILETDHAGAVIRAYNNGTMTSTLTKAVLETCPGTMARANRGTSI